MSVRELNEGGAWEKLRRKWGQADEAGEGRSWGRSRRVAGSRISAHSNFPPT